MSQANSRDLRPSRARVWVGAVLALGVVAGALWLGRDDGKLRVWMLDVGQGECIVARWRGRTVVIDGGSSDRERVGRSSIVPFLQMAGVRRVDALFVSHPDADHFNALPDVVHEIPVSRLYLSPRTLAQSSRGDAWSRFLHVCRARGTEIKGVAAPQVLALSRDDGSRAQPLLIRVLWPTSDAPSASAKSNADSLVLKIEHGATSVLLTGDAESDVEAALSRDAGAANVTVLKVGHHGSKTSSTEPFLRHARPRAAVISCGRYNSFGHPSARVLERLSALGIATKRTDLDGTIEIECSESSCQMSSFR